MIVAGVCDAYVLVGLLWLYVMLLWAWPLARVLPGLRPSTPRLPPRQRSGALKSFPGLIHKPHCAACAQAAQEAEVPALPRHPRR